VELGGPQSSRVRYFFICALTRSRTAWLANWFTQGRAFCVHDAWRYAGSAEELKEYLLDRVPAGCDYLGTADSGNGGRYDELARVFAGARFALIERPPNEVIAATDKLNIVAPYEELVTRVAALQDSHNRLPDSVQRTDYDNLGVQREMARLHQHLTPGVPFCPQRYELLDQLRVEIIEEKYMRHFTSSSSWP
jgi:hypothetical protein